MVTRPMLTIEVTKNSMALHTIMTKMGLSYIPNVMLTTCTGKDVVLW